MWLGCGLRIIEQSGKVGATDWMSEGEIMAQEKKKSKYTGKRRNYKENQFMLVRQDTVRWTLRTLAINVNISPYAFDAQHSICHAE
jgi:hypothetical protein